MAILIGELFLSIHTTEQLQVYFFLTLLVLERYALLQKKRMLSNVIATKHSKII